MGAKVKMSFGATTALCVVVVSVIVSAQEEDGIFNTKNNLEEIFKDFKVTKNPLFLPF